MQLTVALVSEEGAGAKVLQLLVDRGHRVVTVFTRASGTGHTASVAGRAKLLGVPVRDAREVGDAAKADWMRAKGIDLLLNVHSLHIVDATVLEAPTLGAYNLHPGPLPERAGLHAPSWALYEGADRYGVTLHRMTPEIDAGTIAFADNFEIGPTDTGISVMMQCIQRGIRLIEQLLELAERGEAIPSRPQDLTRRRWFSAGPPEGGRLNWHRPARRVADFVRACDYRPFHSPWGFPRCTADDMDIAILTARVIESTKNAAPGTVAHADAGAVLVAAADALVRVDKVEVEGQAYAAAEAIRDGIRLQ
jgi:methionyl-tRNA formyltransferase